MAAWRKALHLRVCRLRQADLGHRGYHYARFEVAADGLVLGGLSRGHPFQRHFGPATPQPTRPRLLQVGVAPGRQTSPGHGRAGPLAGLAEVDETEIPLRTKDDPVAGGGGRSHQGKMLVAGAVEVANGAPGRIRLAEITDFSAPSLHGFIAANVAPGITIRTDGWSGYPGAPDVAHDPHVLGPIAAHVVLPWIHRVFSNLKTWALGVYHGLRKKHLQAYLDEFVFRFNRRRTRHAAFRALLGIGVVIKSATYKMLIQPDVGG